MYTTENVKRLFTREISLAIRMKMFTVHGEVNAV